MDFSVWEGMAVDPDRYVCGEPERTSDTVAWILEKIPHAGRVLELGCGVGRLTIPIALATTCQIVAVDVASRMVDAAPAHERVSYIVNDGESVPPGYFDGAYSVLMFQHLSERYVRGYLHEMASALRPGAPFLFQYVVGNQNFGLDHRYSRRTMLEWAYDAGLGVDEKKVWRDRMQYDWDWMLVDGRGYENA